MCIFPFRLLPLFFLSSALSVHAIYLGWMVDVFGQERQLAELAVVDATVELLVQQPEMLVGATDDPGFAVAGDLQRH